MFHARALPQPQDVFLAQRLLHDVYIGELGWRFSPENPSGLEILHTDAGAILTDRFVSASRYFGVFEPESNAMIACARLLRPVEGRLEVECYHPRSPSATAPAPGRYELNRFAVRGAYLATTAPAYLFRALAEDCARAGVTDLYCALPVPGPSDLMRHIGFEPCEGATFRYEDTDPLPVRLHHLACTDPAALERVIAVCEDLIERGRHATA